METKIVMGIYGGRKLNKGRKRMPIMINICLCCLFLLGCGNSASKPSPDVIKETEKDITKDTAMERYYGYYKITEFYPTAYFPENTYDYQTRQESDMLLGKIVKLQAEQCVTYDCTRWLGVTDEGIRYQGNFSIEKAEVSEPRLYWVYGKGLEEPWERKLDIDNIRQLIKGIDIDGAIILPKLFEPFGTQILYTVSGETSLIMSSTLMVAGYYRLEKLDYDASEQMQEPKELTEREIREILDNLYGTYRVAEFLPTKFYPAPDSSGNIRLPQEEADMMLRKEIQIAENLFTTYDNGRLPNSESRGRAADDFTLDEIRIEKPEYRVKRRNREDIYGLRDDMLSEELVRDQYVEVSVYPGYKAGNETFEDMTLPQIYVIDDNRVLLYCMWEYFILEKMETVKMPATGESTEDNKQQISEESQLDEKADWLAWEDKESLTEFNGGIINTQEELDAIGEMTALETLTVSVGYSDNEKMDFSVLGNLKELRGLYLNFDYNPGVRADFSFIRKLDKLEDLYINKAEIADLSFLSNSGNLKELYLTYVEDCDLMYLKGADKMESMSVCGKHMCNFESLEDMVNMEGLWLTEMPPTIGNKLPDVDLQFTADMDELKILTIANMLVDNVETLKRNQKLKIMMLVNTGIGDISPLWELENLKELGVYGIGAENVKEQGEQFGDSVTVEIAEEVPYGFSD